MHAKGGEGARQGPGEPLSPPPPLPTGSLRPGLRRAVQARSSMPTSGEGLHPHGCTDPSSSSLDTPDLQRSPSSGHQISPWNLLPKLGPAWGQRGQPAPSLQSRSTVTPRLGIGWDRRPLEPDPLPRSTPKCSSGRRGIYWLPCAGSSRGIHSQVSEDRFLRLPRRHSLLPADPEPGEVRWVPTSSPVNFANFSPSDEQKFGDHGPPPPPAPSLV